MATFGERLRELRKKAGIKQKDLAAMLGLKDVTVNRWEHDKQSPDLRTNLEIYESLADIFGVSIAYLSGKSDDDKLQGKSVENNEDAAREAVAAEREHKIRMFRLYSDLSSKSSESVDAVILKLYESDKNHGELVSQQSKANDSIEETSSD